MQQLQKEKTALALKIVKIAEDELGLKRYGKFMNNDYVIGSMLFKFKKQYVFTTKEYTKSFELYKKGVINLETLKAVSSKILWEQLASCGEKEIDAFFGSEKKHGKQIHGQI